MSSLIKLDWASDVLDYRQLIWAIGDMRVFSFASRFAHKTILLRYYSLIYRSQGSEQNSEPSASQYYFGN